MNNVGNGAWVEVTLNSSALTNISRTGRTQFRIYFNSSGASNHFVGWNPGESAENEPQLIIEYQP